MKLHDSFENDKYKKNRCNIITLKLCVDMQNKITYETQQHIKEDDDLKMKLTKIIEYELKNNSNYYNDLVTNLTMMNYESEIYGVIIIDPIDFYIHKLTIIQVITNRFCRSSKHISYQKIREKLINNITSEHILKLLNAYNYRRKINEKYKKIHIENDYKLLKYFPNVSSITFCCVIFGQLLIIFLTYMTILILHKI